MKQNQNIEELLNAFLDNRLTQRQRTELKRLINKDNKIAQQMAELQAELEGLNTQTVETLRAEVDQHQAKVDDLQGQFNRLEREIGAKLRA